MTLLGGLEAVHEVELAAGMKLHAELDLPHAPSGVVVFSHARARRHALLRTLALELQEQGMATVLADLLTDHEVGDRGDSHSRFDVPLQADRLVGLIDWVDSLGELAGLPLAVVGAGVGAPAALVAAARRVRRVAATVSCSGRVELAESWLHPVHAPTLLVVGERDVAGSSVNERAAEQLTGVGRLAVVPGAGPRFEEPGAVQEVGDLVGAWLEQHFVGRRADPGVRSA